MNYKDPASRVFVHPPTKESNVMTQSISIPVTFQNILVSVKPDASSPNGYSVETIPKIPTITNQNTVINYQIAEDGGYPITFTGMTVVPADNGQLSAASVSVDGQLMTFNDLNTTQMTLNVTLEFADKAGVKFAHDPQIRNDPQG